MREPTVGELRAGGWPLWDAVILDPFDKLPMSVFEDLKSEYMRVVLGTDMGKGGKSSGDGPPKE